MLHTMDKSKRDQYKRFHNSLSHVGQYYIISKKTAPLIKRQYTVCNMLIPEIGQAALALLKKGVAAAATEPVEPLPLDLFMDEEGQNGFWLTIKQYGSPAGVATAVHKHDHTENFIAKGPCGKQLFDNLADPNALDGEYCAFAAGTGVFVFYDLVFMIFLQNYSKVQAKTDPTATVFSWFPHEFCFHLYFSYMSDKEEDGVPGIFFCNELVKFNNHHGFHNFSIVRRKSDKKINFWNFADDKDHLTFGHWDKKFIAHFLIDHGIILKDKVMDDEIHAECDMVSHSHDHAKPAHSHDHAKPVTKKQAIPILLVQDIELGNSLSKE